MAFDCPACGGSTWIESGRVLVDNTRIRQRRCWECDCKFTTQPGADGQEVFRAWVGVDDEWTSLPEMRRALINGLAVSASIAIGLKNGKPVERFEIDQEELDLARLARERKGNVLKP